MKKLFLLVIMVLLFVSATYLTPANSASADDEVTQTVAKAILPEHKHTADCEKTLAEPVQIICILDRSGSMYSLANDVIGGYNSFLENQRKEPGEAEVTTVLFDDKYEKITDAVDLREVKDLTSAEYFARGNTALMDAIGRTITETSAKMERDGICPAKRRVLVMIMTDGLENASREYNKAAVKALIDETTKNYEWNYIFIGANMDSASEATSIGINADHAMDYAADSEGVMQSFERMDDAAKEVREKGRVD